MIMGHDVQNAIVIWLTASVGFGAPYFVETICKAVSLRTLFLAWIFRHWYHFIRL